MASPRIQLLNAALSHDWIADANHGGDDPLRTIELNRGDSSIGLYFDLDGRLMFATIDGLQATSLDETLGQLSRVPAQRDESFDAPN